MPRTRDFLKTACIALAGLTILAALSTLGFWFQYGNPTVPRLEQRWWAGYYVSETGEKHWCIARFFDDSGHHLRMALLGSSGRPRFFDVERSSSNPTFVYLTIKNAFSGELIEAKELYSGERYYFGRLSAGRFGDFWKENDDIAIRGSLVGPAGQHEFGIEPIAAAKMDVFWRQYVRPDTPVPSPSEILSAK